MSHPKLLVAFREALDAVQEFYAQHRAVLTAYDHLLDDLADAKTKLKTYAKDRDTSMHGLGVVVTATPTSRTLYDVKTLLNYDPQLEHQSVDLGGETKPLIVKSVDAKVLSLLVQNGVISERLMKEAERKIPITTAVEIKEVFDTDEQEDPE